jgi:hypothetical protein
VAILSDIIMNKNLKLLLINYLAQKAGVLLHFLSRSQFTCNRTYEGSMFLQKAGIYLTQHHPITLKKTVILIPGRDVLWLRPLAVSSSPQRLGSIPQSTWWCDRLITKCLGLVPSIVIPTLLHIFSSVKGWYI